MNDKNTVFEQLSEVQQELQALKANKRTLQDQINENDPIIADFIKSAKRVFRFAYGKSDLERINKKAKNRLIFEMLFLSLLFIAPFLTVTKPFGWIMPIISGVLCVSRAAISAVLLRPRKCEYEYDEIMLKHVVAEYDDNGIIQNIRPRWWVKANLVGLTFLPIAVGVNMIYLSQIKWMAYVGIAFCFLPGLAARIFRNHRVNYSLHFVDEKNDVEYEYLKEYMTRNNLK